MMPERYEASIVSLENTKDLSKITLTEVLHALQAQEQQRLMRQDHVVEGALPAKHHEVVKNKKNFFKQNQFQEVIYSYTQNPYCSKKKSVEELRR